MNMDNVIQKAAHEHMRHTMGRILRELTECADIARALGLADTAAVINKMEDVYLSHPPASTPSSGG